LTKELQLPTSSTIIDLACGKGRHSVFLNKLGYEVLGLDLSKQSIEHNKQFENETLHFKVHDMRNPIDSKPVDAVFNLFTSFGYFENDEDNLTTLNAIKESLTDYGFAVIDFMNVTHVIDNLVPEEVKSVDGIDFHIKRYVKDNHIFKEIDFDDNGEHFHFTEKVKALTLQDFETMMEEVGIFLLDVFGDYKLRKFLKNDSERLIMIFK
ncbi:MAG: class I SAM-dependent methyltransferase, partial [Flavobacterium sp.]|nr:class I SAM-dependent methyltransferase [Flavobacterium sp.]